MTKGSTYLITTALLIAPLTGCGFDPSSAKHDETRYKELQRADCNQMASLGSNHIISKIPKDKQEILTRCEKMKKLTLEEYKRASQHARDHGEWDLDNIPPAAP